MTRYLNQETLPKLSGVRIGEYELPFKLQFTAGEPPESVFVRVRSQSMDFMNRFAVQQEKGGEVAKNATYNLVAQSVVDENETPVYDAADIKKLATADCRLVSALVKIITVHNGGKDDDAEQVMEKLEA